MMFAHIEPECVPCLSEDMKGGQKKKYNPHFCTFINLLPQIYTALIVPNERNIAFLGTSSRKHLK